MDENKKEFHFKLEVVKFYREMLIDWTLSLPNQEEPKGIECMIHIRKKIESSKPMLTVFI